MNTSLWHQELLRAANPDEVLSSTLDYLALWRPDELAQLPEPLDAAMLAAPGDISTYAGALLAHEKDAGRMTASREALTAFFTIAARRLAELSAATVAASIRARQAVEAAQA